MPKDYIATYIKYARDEKEALSYIIKGKKDLQNFVIFKRGGSGMLISIEED